MRLYLDASAIIYSLEGAPPVRELARVLERATELRAQHGFKTPDAIHLATALVQAADVFLTGDTGLSRCPGIEVVVLDPAAHP